jgi:hypothetical protein
MRCGGGFLTAIPQRHRLPGEEAMGMGLLWGGRVKELPDASLRHVSMCLSRSVRLLMAAVRWCGMASAGVR